MPAFFFKGALAFAFGFVFFYAFWRLVGGRPLRWHARTVWLYMGIAFPIFLVCEVCSGELHELLFGDRLWTYQIRPIHDGYTSRYNFIIWPLYGWHLYLCNQVLANFSGSPRTLRMFKALKHAASGPALEIIANLAMLLLIHRYYFYYPADDLWHLTSVRIVPYYFAASLLFTWVIRHVSRWGHEWTSGLVGYALGAAYLLMP